jgi:hypothetical protein
MYKRGDYHALPPGTLHETVIPPDQFAATLMLASPQQMRQCTVPNENNIALGTYERPRLSHTEPLTVLQSQLTEAA